MVNQNRLFNFSQWVSSGLRIKVRIKEEFIVMLISVMVWVWCCLLIMLLIRVMIMLVMVLVFCRVCFRMMLWMLLLSVVIVLLMVNSSRLISKRGWWLKWFDNMLKGICSNVCIKLQVLMVVLISRGVVLFSLVLQMVNIGRSMNSLNMCRVKIVVRELVVVNLVCCSVVREVFVMV